MEREPRRVAARAKPARRPRPPEEAGPTEARAPWLPTLVVAALTIVAFAHNLGITWRKWGDLVIDCGRELEVARNVADGLLLYRDVRHYYGPLAPYVNGALMAVFGVRAGVLMAAGAVSAALMCVLVYLLARRFTGRVGAATVAAAFVYLCAFGHYYVNGSFNWVLPYNYGATYGMLAATASLWLLVRHAEDGRGGDLYGSAALLAASALAKPETFLPATAAHALFVVTARPRLGAYAAAAVGVLGVYGLFAALAPSFVQDYLASVAGTGGNPVLLRMMGVADWRDSLAAAGRSALALAGAVATTAAAARIARVTGNRVAQVGTAAGAALGASLLIVRVPVTEQLRALPLALLLLFGYWTQRWWRAPAERAVILPRLLLLAFALASLVRLPLAAGVQHYGFYLLPVPLVALAVAWFADLPRWLPGAPHRAVGWAGVALFAALTITHHRTSRELWDMHTARVATPRGEMLLLDGIYGFPLGTTYAEAVGWLRRFPPETRVLAIPQGVGLAFLAGLTPCCGEYSFLPADLTDAFEERLMGRLERQPPDLVVHVAVNLGEYGSRGIGADYGRRLAAWVRANYEPVATFGPQQYVLIYRRRT
jgi:hypothetical protein